MARQGPPCSYCEGNPASRLADASEVYGPSYSGRFNLWVCARYPDCDAYVGVHHNSPDASPKGSLANKTLRELRIKVHAEFDELWKSKRMTRKQAYTKLALLMGKEDGHAHVGWFSEEECRRALMALVAEDMTS